MLTKEHNYNHWFIMNKCNSRRECVGGFSHSTVSHFFGSATTPLIGGILRVRDLGWFGYRVLSWFPGAAGASILLCSPLLQFPI